MMAFRVEVDLSEFRKGWAAMQHDLVDTARNSADEGAKAGAEYARNNHAWQNRTGNLQDSIRAVTGIPTERGGKAMFEAGAKYASFLEEGTRPHVIRPKNKKALAFYWENEGIDFVGPYVNHPGTDPMPYMGPAYLKAERVIIARILAGIPEAQRVLDAA